MARSILVYTDFSKQPVLAFKHGDKPEMAHFLGKLLLQADSDIWENVDCIVPVPLHWTRRLKRKYNQAGLLGEFIGRQKKIPFCPNILIRSKVTESQGHKKKREREKNIKNAFRVTYPDRIRGKSVLLVDDVMTTGSTLNECAKMLKKSGARSVKAITVYRTISN